MTIARHLDAFGQEIRGCHHSGAPFEIVERDDGSIDPAESTRQYFAGFKIGHVDNSARSVCQKRVAHIVRCRGTSLSLRAQEDFQ